MDRGYGRCFFFQAEDGIRDLTVTGVQTCALPIFEHDRVGVLPRELEGFAAVSGEQRLMSFFAKEAPVEVPDVGIVLDREDPHAAMVGPRHPARDGPSVMPAGHPNGLCPRPRIPAAASIQFAVGRVAGLGRYPVSGPGSASRRSSLTYAVFAEPQQPKKPGFLVDAILIATGFSAVWVLVLLVMQNS